jgi:arylsulfatase A-like enzyme
MGDTKVETPTMDALARGGVTFTQGHVTVPYCRPSLRTMITGLYPVQYQMRLDEHIERRRREDASYASLSDADKRMWMSVEKANGMRIFDALPKLLKARGYVSWQGGKWWENSYRSAHFDEGMTEGWDMSKFGTDDFFHEMMGAEGERTRARNHGSAVRLHRPASRRAHVHLVRVDVAAHAAGRSLLVPQVLRGSRAHRIGEAVLRQHQLVG